MVDICEEKKALTVDYLRKMDAYFRAANYLSACQLYLIDNPLLKEPLKKEHIKSKIVGHWGTVPGQNFIYVHLNRVIKKYDLDMIYLSGPGHGGNFMIANTYLEGTYSEKYPDISEDEDGLKKLFKQFSFPGGVSSHVAPETPGSIHEGGELGYSLAHAFGAVFDNPNLIATCVVGDGESETGPLATSWHSNKFLNPKTDGAVLPILHLNGYKISNPTVLSRISKDELKKLFEGYGYKPYFVEGDNPMVMHQIMAITLDHVIEEIKYIWKCAREDKISSRPLWPMIILRTPKGWTGPKYLDGSKIEGNFKSHQVPITMDKEENIKILESWLKSYHPEELFDENGKFKQELRDLAPIGDKRLGSNLHTNGGLLLKSLKLPDYRKYGVNFKGHGTIKTQDMLELSGFIRDVFEMNKENHNFRAFGPDESMSNRLYKMFEVTNRAWENPIVESDEYLATDGRIMDSMLSEHLCEGWLEGYILTGRHGFFASYEAFIRVVDSMVTQHAKWLKTCNNIPWRQKISSLNLILTSNVWQQDHNGYTHQDPGFLNHIVDKKSDVIMTYLPPDANTLIYSFNECLKSRNKINVVVASKQPSYQWLTMDEAVKHCTKGIGVWQWASNDFGQLPDVILACAGDTPTLEALGAVTIMHKYLPDIKIRFINVVNLMKLSTNHPSGLTNEEYDLLFTKDKPIIFNFHGYPSLIYSLIFSRNNHNISVHGYKEEGAITTPFDMRVLNEIDRFHLVIDIVNHLPSIGSRGTYLVELMKDKLIEHTEYIKDKGIDMEEIQNWKWK